jgi:hypothetical protein
MQFKVGDKVLLKESSYKDILAWGNEEGALVKGSKLLLKEAGVVEEVHLTSTKVRIGKYFIWYERSEIVHANPVSTEIKWI